MIKMSIRVKPNINAQKEFEQTLVGTQIDDTHISGLIDKWLNDKGCINYVLHRENENKFCLESEWLSRKELEDHFRSKDFMLLMGAIDVLCEKPVVKINDDKSSFGMEFIKSALGE
jgi:quinol monooxygenase YgiN